MYVILGSGSPRRHALLSDVGIPLRVVVGDVDERCHAGEAPESYLERIVDAKRSAVCALLPPAEHSFVLVADTIVCLGESILGKPADDADALNMLTRLSGTAHTVMTRYALARRSGAELRQQTVKTAVHMRATQGSLLAAYVATGEGRDKAGAYAIQGGGAALISRIEGSPSNVVGLPLCEVLADLASVGVYPWATRE